MERPENWIQDVTLSYKVWYEILAYSAAIFFGPIIQIDSIPLCLLAYEVPRLILIFN